jgi:WD40 repeat protein
MTPTVRRWIWMVAAAAVLGAGCGAGNGTASATSTPSPSSLASASASPAPCGSATRCLALVTLRGSSQVVVRDITDIAHPSTVGVVGPAPALNGIGPSLEGSSGQFASSTQVAYLGGNTDDSYGLPTSLIRAPLAGSPTTTVLSGSRAVVVFAWSPDGSTLAYLTPTDFTGVELHQVKANADRVLATLPAIAVGGCEVAPCPGPFQNPGDTWDFRLAYSPDGNYISVVQSGITSYLRIFTADGKQVAATDSQGTTMSVWSGNNFYFRDSVGVEVWRNGAVSTLLRGVSWIRPKASSDGRFIVYEARQLGAANIFILDTTTGQVRALGAGSEPAFLTSRYVWFEAEPPCVPSGTCQAGFPGIAAGKTYIYDMEAGTKSESAITSVLDVWPHAA